MATTSLWHIKGRLSDLIAYVENPEKTVPSGTRTRRKPQTALLLPPSTA